MSHTKRYPRATVKRHPNLNGWVIDLIWRAGAKPQRVAATYASIPWAHKAARRKLGLKSPAPGNTASAGQATGTCDTCGRPMRPAGSRASAYPGTMLRQREGLCQPCNQKAKRKFPSNAG